LFSLTGAQSVETINADILSVGNRFEHRDSKVSDINDTAYLELAFKTISFDLLHLCMGSNQENLTELQNYIPL
jgi:hypothetical protein